MWSLGSDYPLSDVKKLVQIRSYYGLGDGFPLGHIMYYVENERFKKYLNDNRPANGKWTWDTVKKLFDDNTFSMNYYVGKTVFAEGIFPWWPMKETEIKPYRDVVKQERDSGKNIIKNTANLYCDGKISEDFILKMFEGIINTHENKPIKDVINEWKLHKTNGTRPALL